MICELLHEFFNDSRLLLVNATVLRLTRAALTIIRFSYIAVIQSNLINSCGYASFGNAKVVGSTPIIGTTP